MTKAAKEMATQVANEAAIPAIRSMYPSRSRDQAANEFRHFILTGVEWEREPWAAFVEHVLEMDCFTPGGSNEAWARRLLAGERG